MKNGRMKGRKNESKEGQEKVKGWRDEEKEERTRERKDRSRDQRKKGWRKERINGRKGCKEQKTKG